MRIAGALFAAAVAAALAVVPARADDAVNGASETVPDVRDPCHAQKK